VALTARAFGAERIFIDKKDRELEKTLSSVCQRFGEGFIVQTGVHPKTILNEWPGIIIHLTMYGENLEKTIKKIRKDQDILVVVGAEKVPGYVYEAADYNIAVGNQPHSEVAALAVFLDRYTKGSWQNIPFKGSMTIIPCAKGKHVVSTKKE